MKSRKTIFTLVSYALVLAIALIGGSWGISYAQTTIGPLAPGVIPVTGGDICKAGTSYTSGVVAELGGVKASALDDKGNPCLTVEAGAGNLGNGQAIKIDVVDNNTANVNLVNPLTEVFNVGTVDPNYTLTHALTQTFTLTDAELEAFKANPNMGVLWYDAANGKWVKLDAVVQGNQVIVQTDKVGLFTIGTIL